MFMRLCWRVYFLLIFTFTFSSHAFAQKSILIAYHSQTGSTSAMAESVASGVKSVAGVLPIVKKISDVTSNDLLKADAIILGTPVHNAQASAAVVTFISSWPFENQPLKNKLGAVFVTAGGISAGEELVQMQILQSMLIFGIIVVGGDEWTSAFGASAITHEAPFTLTDTKQPAKQFLDKAFALGKRVATLTHSMQSK
jgi:NAD(P)H dehydrogenase (quinone)